MPGQRRIFMMLLLGLLLAGSGLAAAGEEHVLAGIYTTGYQDGPGRVRAIFTARSDSEGESWDVVFRFTFNNREHEYRGVAEGGLTEGGLSGKVRNENGSRTFSFQGEHKKGKFRATHAEVFEDGEEKTGTMTLTG